MTSKMSYEKMDQNRRETSWDGGGIIFSSLVVGTTQEWKKHIFLVRSDHFPQVGIKMISKLKKWNHHTWS